MFTFRPATLADAKRICEINHGAFGYDYPEEKTRERLASILAKTTDKLLVACKGDWVIGYIHGSDYNCTYADFLKSIISLAVDEAQRTSGVGRGLMEAVEAWALADGCGGVRLVSGIDRLSAHGFYLHCGYKVRKEQKNFIKFSPPTLIVRENRLPFQFFL